MHAAVNIAKTAWEAQQIAKHNNRNRNAPWLQMIEPANRGLKIFLGVLCVLVMGATLSAGLWPFSFQVENQAWWKPERAGLYFADSGMVVSREKFSGMPSDAARGCSIELWAEPALAWDSSTLLSFYNPQASSHIQLRQSGGDFAFTRTFAPDHKKGNPRSIFLDHALQKGQAILITLTSSGGALNVYLNGVFRASTRSVELRGTDFAGTLIVGNTPYDNLTFSGTIRGLAFYDHALSPEEVRQDERIWLKDKEGMVQSKARPYSLYLFNENRGSILHNLGRAGPDLELPKHFFIFQPAFLAPFWREYQTSWWYAQDLAINVFGLVPLGFCFAALLAWFTGRKRSLLYTTLLGFCVSLTIEVLQAYMPTRHSGTTDIITNTSGTALGAWLYLNAYAQDCCRRRGLVRSE